MRKTPWFSALSAIVCMGCATTPLISELNLGKVVVYRNGVAFFERYADVSNGEFSVLIAKSRVNDLLKSLKVEDAFSGRLLAVSFPGNNSDSGSVVRMRIGVPTHTRRVKLSYVSESTNPQTVTAFGSGSPDGDWDGQRGGQGVFEF